jgi:2-polyprenyl-6-methoxyphenol hydroxylase-like FAD-dependent oxidoreductase
LADCDVLIVGAGPVGLLTALTLAQAGAKVMVIEGNAAPNDSPRAASYFATSLIVFRELGILDDVDARGIRVNLFGHHVPEYDFHARISTECMKGITYDYQLHVGQHIVCGIVIDRLRQLDMPVLFGHRLTGLHDDGGLVRATIETAEGVQQIDARWVVGADGARSAVRRLAGIAWDGFTWDNHFIATNVYCDMASLGYQQANFICDPVSGGVVAQLDAEGLWRLTYSEDAWLEPETYRDRLPSRYRGFIPKGMQYEIASSSPYALHQRCSETLRKGRVLLAGDAGHTTNPCGGLGLTSGMWTGVVLADLLGAVLKGDEDAAILDRWSDERRRIFLDIVNPGAIRNKVMMEERDPDQRRKDMEGVKPMIDNPDLAKLMMLFPFRVIGDPLRAGSRWTGADPTPAAGVELSERHSQLA